MTWTTLDLTPIKIGRKSVWLESEINDRMQARVAEREDAA